MKIRQVLEALEQFAPLPLQESWDNAGLQLGLTEADVSGALLCLDVNEQIVDEALFRGLKQISGADYVQRCVIKALKNDIVIISMHTNMDNAKNGVNWKIAERLGLQKCQFFAQKQVGDVEAGSGVVGELPQPMAADDFVLMVKRQFGVECALCNELLRRPIQKVALCGGAGDFLLDDALHQGADAFITGEMHYHQYFGYEQRIQICVIGHYQSEQFTSEIFRDIINKECPGVRTEIAETNTNPILYI